MFLRCSIFFKVNVCLPGWIQVTCLAKSSWLLLYFISYLNTSNFIKNIPLGIVFLTLFSVFGYPDETLSLVFDILDASFVALYFLQYCINGCLHPKIQENVRLAIVLWALLKPFLVQSENLSYSFSLILPVLNLYLSLIILPFGQPRPLPWN